MGRPEQCGQSRCTVSKLKTRPVLERRRGRPKSRGGYCPSEGKGGRAGPGDREGSAAQEIIALTKESREGRRYLPVGLRKQPVGSSESRGFSCGLPVLSRRG